MMNPADIYRQHIAICRLCVCVFNREMFTLHSGDNHVDMSKMRVLEILGSQGF